MTRKVFAGVSVAVVGSLAVASAVSAQGPFGRGDDRYRDHHPVFGILMMVAFAAAVALVTWLVLRRRPAVAGAPATPMAAPIVPSGPVAPVSPTAGAETILAERLARSEISPDDYRSMLAALRGGEATPAPEPPSAD